jgi:uncharacterized protein (DUF4415 family)
MTRRQRLERNDAAVRGHSKGARASARRPKTSGAGARSGRRKTLTLQASAEESSKKSFSIQNMDLYRPLKKPVTLRLDADVLAWFKKDGSRYQTRINRALRKVMEREMKEK